LSLKLSDTRVYEPQIFPRIDTPQAAAGLRGALKAEQDAGAVRLKDAAAADARSADEAKVLSICKTVNARYKTVNARCKTVNSRFWPHIRQSMPDSGLGFQVDTF